MQGLKNKVGLMLRKDFDIMNSIKALIDETSKNKFVILQDEEQMWTQLNHFLQEQKKKSQRKLKQIEDKAAKIANQVIQEEEHTEEENLKQINNNQQSQQYDNDNDENDYDNSNQDENEDEYQNDNESDNNENNNNIKQNKQKKDDFDEFEKYLDNMDGKIDLDNDNDISEEEIEDDNEVENQSQQNEGEDSVFDEMREDQLEQIEQEDQEIEQDYQEINNSDSEIGELEKQRLKKKDWQFGGEVKAKQRPLNSLVEQDIDFDINRKNLVDKDPQQQSSLIELIKKRVQDELFDDRQKTQINLNSLEKPSDNVDTNKSQFGLAELYERQFKQALGLPTNTSEQKLKQELFEAYRELCYKLDSLTNLNFEPRGFVKQAEIKLLDNNIIQKEEKVPLTIHGSQQEDIEKIKKINFISKNEADHETNKKAHRLVKQRKRNREREKKRSGLIKKLENKGESKFMYKQHQEGKKQMSLIKKQKNKESVKFDKTSTFFKNLQESGVQKKSIKK